MPLHILRERERERVGVKREGRGEERVVGELKQVFSYGEWVYQLIYSIYNSE